jgi:hypothetical protein
MAEDALQTQPLSPLQRGHNTLQLNPRRRPLPGHPAVNLKMNRNPPAGALGRGFNRLHMLPRPNHGSQAMLHNPVSISRLDPAHHQHVSFTIPESPANARALVDISHPQPRHARIDKHRRDQFRAMSIAVGLDNRKHVGVCTSGGAYRGDVIPQPQL